MFSTNQLRAIPRNLIQNWLKSKDLAYSGNVFDRIDAHITDEKLSSTELESLLDEYKDNGRKHVFLFNLSEDEWGEFSSPNELKSKFDSFTSSENSRLIFGMNLEKSVVEGDTYTLRLVRVIQVPKIDKDTKITHEGREWAAILYVDVPVHIIFRFNVKSKTLNLKFDSVKEMGHEKEKIYSTSLDFLKKVFQIENISTIGLTKLASVLEGDSTTAVFNLIGKVETEDEEGNTMTGTVHLTRDDSQTGSASALPGGKDVLSSENKDVLLDTYDVLWLQEQSNEKLTRNVRTTIRSLSGNIHFRHHVFREEMEYVLSNIRKATTGQ